MIKFISKTFPKLLFERALLKEQWAALSLERYVLNILSAKTRAKVKAEANCFKYW